MQKIATCSSCPYWEMVGDAPGPTNDRKRLGWCNLEPGTLIPIPSQNMAGQVQVSAHVVRPQKNEGECCSHHPAVVRNQWCSIAVAVISIWKHWLDYDPAKHPDQDFSRIPSFSEAKHLAQYPQKGETDGSA